VATYRGPRNETSAEPIAVQNSFYHQPPKDTFVQTRLLAAVDKILIGCDVLVVFCDSAAGSLAALLESSHILVQHDAVVDERGLHYKRHATQRASHGVACCARVRRLFRTISQAECTVGVRVCHGLRVWCERAPEVDAGGIVGDDVVAAVLAVLLAVFVVAAQGVLLEVLGRCKGC
jgi:hypothetical protein